MRAVGVELGCVASPVGPAESGNAGDSGGHGLKQTAPGDVLARTVVVLHHLQDAVGRVLQGLQAGAPGEGCMLMDGKTMQALIVLVEHELWLLTCMVQVRAAVALRWQRGSECQ